MARLTYPTRSEVQQRLKAQPDFAPDALSRATANDDGGFTVAIADEGSLLGVTYRPSPAPHWILEPAVPGDPGDPVVLPESILNRANRLLLADGPRLERDWRTKAHRLVAAPRRVLPLLNHGPVLAGQTATGWQAAGVADWDAAGPLFSAPPPAPVAPQPAPAAGPPGASLSDPVALPVEGQPDLQILQASAYEGDVILSRETRAKWAAARSLYRQTGKPIVVAMVGPSGQAKTHAVHALGADEGMDVVRFDASGVTDPDQWFGTITLNDGNTAMMPSALLYAITMEGKRILLVDEANRAAVRAMNALLPILEYAHHVTIPQTGKPRPINRDVQIVLTANIGSEFVGVEPLDEAIRNRVGLWLHLDYLSEDENTALILNRYADQPLPKSMLRRDFDSYFKEREPMAVTPYEAGNIARLGALLLESSKTGAHPAVSTRQMLAAAGLTAVGLSPRLAVDGAILDGFDHEGGSQSAHDKALPHVTGIVWKEPQPGDVFTAADGVGDTCQCGHDAATHGIGDIVSVSTHCRECARQHPGSASQQCMAFNPAMAPVGTP